VSIKRPNLVLEQFFAGQFKGWGVTLSRNGKIENQFSIEAVGTWDESVSALSLTETYSFDDGHSDVLSWTIIKKSNNRYVGKERKIIGRAKGSQSGNHFLWSYRRDTPQKNKRVSRLAYSDHFMLMTPNLLLVTASITKWGFSVATLNVIYQKL
jgi:Protein of unknown function (DUF3833)